jgi:hypothetical protein
MGTGAMLHGILYGLGLHVGKLNNESRMMATTFGRPDRLTTAAQCHDHTMHVARVPAKTFFFSARANLDAQSLVGDWYGFDTPMSGGDAYVFEVEALGAKMIYSDKTMPTVDYSDPLIKTPEDLKTLKPLDPTKGRIPYVIELNRLACEELGGNILGAGGIFCSPFSLVCQAMGYEGVIRAMRKNPKFLHDVFQWLEDNALLAFLKAQRDGAGVKSAIGADAWAAFPDLTPKLMHEWALPPTLSLIKRGKEELGMTIQAGFGAGDYCEEDPAKFDADIIRACMEAGIAVRGGTPMIFMAMGRVDELPLQVIQDYAVEKGKFPITKLLIYAGLNARVLRDRTPEQIAAIVRRYIDVMGRDGRFLPFLANIPADAPPVNIHTAVQAIKTYGTSPIAKDLNSVPFKIPTFEPFQDYVTRLAKAGDQRAVRLMAVQEGV